MVVLRPGGVSRMVIWNRTGDGGTHLEGLKSIVTRTVNAMARKAGKLKDASGNITGEFVREVSSLYVWTHGHTDTQVFFMGEYDTRCRRHQKTKTKKCVNFTHEWEIFCVHFTHG